MAEVCLSEEGTIFKGKEVGQNADQNNKSGSHRGKLDSDPSRGPFADGRIVWAPHPLNEEWIK
jgi:hypothetical protein